MLAALGGPTRLVDVRSPQEYSGELIAMPGYEHEGAQRAGHIPGAASVPWAQAVREDGTFKCADELRELYARASQRRRRSSPTAASASARRTPGSSCTSCSASDDVKNYDGSWTEWGNLVGVPIERGAA